jgi:hypothetical protein
MHESQPLGEIGPQALIGTGYANISQEQEITFSMSITKIADERFGCPEEGAFNSGQYTTGNTILCGEEDKAGGVKKQINWKGGSALTEQAAAQKSLT